LEFKNKNWIPGQARNDIEVVSGFAHSYGCDLTQCNNGRTTAQGLGSALRLTSNIIHRTIAFNPMLIPRRPVYYGYTNI